jgi:hypothetical protein
MKKRGPASNTKQFSSIGAERITIITGQVTLVCTQS